MTALLQLALAFVLGSGAAMQLSMVGSMGRLRGPAEAAWLSLFGSITGIAIVLTVRSLRGEGPDLPAPFDRTLVLAGVVLLLAATVTASTRGLDPYYAFTGLFATAFLIGVAFLVPRVGVALFFSGATTGTVAAGIIFDHLGAFGAEPVPASVARMMGVALVAAGTIWVRIAS